MWDDGECRESRADGSAIISSWVIVALILVGVFAWWPLDQIMTTTAPIVADRDALGSGESPAVPDAVAPRAGPGQNAAAP